MTGGSNATARIALLEARAAIADLVHGYAANVRAGRGADCAGLFTDDAVFEIRDGQFGSDASELRARLEGCAAIGAYVARSTSSDARVCPLIHNLVVRVNGHEATSDCAMTGLVWPDGKTLVGEYRDSFRKDGGTWRFSARVFIILGEFGGPPA